MIWLARHGQTEWNKGGRWQGHLDSPLTNEGWASAEALARFASLADIDAVACSPLGRARDTAGVSAAVGVPLIVIDELAEMDHGRMAGLTGEEAGARFSGELASRENDKYRWRFPGGESYADVDTRARSALRRIDLLDARRVLVVSHEMIGRMLLHALSDVSLADALHSRQPHNVVYEIELAIKQVARISLDEEVRYRG